MDTLQTGKATRTAFERLVEQEWASLSATLQECGEIAVMRLSQALADAVANAASKMFDHANQSLTPAEREHWLAAADYSRAVRINLGHDFSRHLQAKYCHACTQAVGDEASGKVAPHIVEHNNALGSLDVEFDKQFSQFVTKDSLQRISDNYAVLLGVELRPADMPIGPAVIRTAIMDTFRTLPGSVDAKQRLLHTLYPEFLVKAGMLYRDLNGFMLALGVMPKPLARRYVPQDAKATQDAEVAQAVRPAPAETVRSGIMEQKAAGCAVGDWIEYRHTSKPPRPLKLVWVSPLQSLYLWATAEGRRAFCLSTQELADMFACGKIQRIAPPENRAAPSDTTASRQKTA
jgi:hypothetical protein